MNIITGDGYFEVGVDIKAGKWKITNADVECYWSIHRDSSRNSIVANHVGGGPQTVTVTEGQYLELLFCGTWKRVG